MHDALYLGLYRKITVLRVFYGPVHDVKDFVLFTYVRGIHK